MKFIATLSNNLHFTFLHKRLFIPFFRSTLFHFEFFIFQFFFSFIFILNSMFIFILKWHLSNKILFLSEIILFLNFKLCPRVS